MKERMLYGVKAVHVGMALNEAMLEQCKRLARKDYLPLSRVISTAIRNAYGEPTQEDIENARKAQGKG